VKGAAHLKNIGKGDQGPSLFELDESLSGYIEGPTGYRRILHWGVTDTPIETRYPGLTVADAERFLAKRLDETDPWCCCVSFSEPNEALVVGRETWDRYDPAQIPLPENFFDDMTDRPNIYARGQQIGRRISEDHWRAARACYFGRITELDDQVGRLTEQLEQARQLENTIIVFLSDHGRYVGAHGFDAHNFGPFEEIYRIPLIISGPNIASSETSSTKAEQNTECFAQVSIADLGSTICELGGAGQLTDAADSHSFAALLAVPDDIPADFATGYAEYHGTRFSLTQRILWQDEWKFVFNGFDFDELYNLDKDSSEMRNLINDPDQQARIESMMTNIWQYVRETNDRAINESHYFSMRFARVGPDSSLRILYLHGLGDRSGGSLPRFLQSQGCTVIEPDLPDLDFEECVRVAQREFDASQPDLLLGYSMGGSAAINIQTGDTPQVLIAPSWKYLGDVTSVKMQTIIINADNDDLIPLEDTKELLQLSSLNEDDHLVVAGDGHGIFDAPTRKTIHDVIRRAASMWSDSNS
jgi:hypothetical protein